MATSAAEKIIAWSGAVKRWSEFSAFVSVICAVPLK
jgi:hypothetical protein